MERSIEDWSPFPVGGRPFTPLAYLHRVDLPDFGCEGRPDGGEAAGAVWGERLDGPHFWRIGEAALLAAGLRDDLWVGLLDGALVLVPQDGASFVAARPGLALEAVLHEAGVAL